MSKFRTIKFGDCDIVCVPHPLFDDNSLKTNKMRRPERIPIVMRNLDIEKFLADNLTQEQYSKALGKIDLLKAILNDRNKIEEGWTEVYDMRLGQYLVTQGYIPDNQAIWNVEEVDYMIDHNMIEARDIRFWGVNYTKDMKKLEETEYHLIKDLETEHIEAILGKNGQGRKWVRDDSVYATYFENELERRTDENICDE